MKRFLYYFVWTIFIGFIIYFGVKYYIHLKEELRSTFQIMPVVRFGSLFPIVIGLFLRLPKLIIEIKEQKKWTFDWIKFVAIAVPSLYIIIMSILPYSSFGENLIPIPAILIENSILTITAGIVFGYVLLDSVKK